MARALTGFVKRLRDIMRNDPGVNGDAQRIEQIVWPLFLKAYDAKETDWEFEDENYVSIVPENCRWRAWGDNKSGKGLTGDELLDFVNNELFPTLKNLPVDASTPTKQAVVRAVFTDANNYMKDGVLLRQIIDEIGSLNLDDYEESRAFAGVYEQMLKELQSAGAAGEFYTPRAVTDFMAEAVEPKIGETMADLACGTGGFITSWLKELSKRQKKADDVQKIADSVYGIEKKQLPYILCVTNMLVHGADEPRIYHDNALLRDLLDYTDDDRFDVILMNPPYGGSEKLDVQNHFPKDLRSSETADLFVATIAYRLKRGGRAAVVLPDGFLFGSDAAKTNIKRKLLTEFNLHTIVRLPGSVFAPYTSIATNLLFFDRTGATRETWFYRLDMPDGYKHFSKTKPMTPEHFEPVRAWWKNRVELEVDGAPKAKRFDAAELGEASGFDWDRCGFPRPEEEILDPKETIERYQTKRAELNRRVDATLAAIREKLGIATEDEDE